MSKDKVDFSWIKRMFYINGNGYMKWNNTVFKIYRFLTKLFKQHEQ